VCVCVCVCGGGGVNALAHWALDLALSGLGRCDLSWLGLDLIECLLHLLLL
jgi:hypothetical protein